MSQWQLGPLISLKSLPSLLLLSLEQSAVPILPNPAVLQESRHDTLKRNTVSPFNLDRVHGLPIFSFTGSYMLEHHVARNLEDNIEREEELRFLSQFTIANVFLVLPKAFEWAPDLPCSGPVRLTRTAVL